MSNNNYKNNFCSSPWFHMRITNSGDYEYCRWANNTPTHNIKTTTPEEYFQHTLQPLRQLLLDGQRPLGCRECHQMEQHGKVSGRQKQLLKTGIQLDQFEKTLASSPWAATFVSDDFKQLPQDWQIDLGNFCNGACVFCNPGASSKLATEWKKIGFINEMPPANWCDDPQLVDRFIELLKQTPHIRYLHFIGGETVITPAFKTILSALVEAGLNKTATIGFTTNLSVWRDDIVNLLEQFHNVNLGMSIESFSIVNDYVRWPACLPTVFENLEKWEAVGKKNSWLIQLRTTPTCLTVGKLLPIYDYALEHNIAVESCNFLNNPQVLRPSVLPKKYREPIIEKMQRWVQQHKDQLDSVVVNTRHPDTIKSQLVQDLNSYVNYFKQEPDQSYLLPDLVNYLKRIEASRGNSILNYLPEYEELFKSAGY